MVRTRALTNAEITAANAVFNGTIDFNTVRMQDDYGLGNAFWVSPPVPVVFPYFVLHMGPSYYDVPNPSSSFMHELTHVWQGQHLVPFLYVLNSGAHQGWSTVNTGNSNAAYAYGGESEQMQWRQYNVEQQARIVQDWFSPSLGKQSTTDWRFRYISANIRTGNPNADSSPVVSSPRVFTRIAQFRPGILQTRFRRR